MISRRLPLRVGRLVAGGKGCLSGWLGVVWRLPFRARWQIDKHRRSTAGSVGFGVAASTEHGFSELDLEAAARALAVCARDGQGLATRKNVAGLERSGTRNSPTRRLEGGARLAGK